METIIIEAEGKNLDIIKAYLKEINVSFKTKTKSSKKKGKGYDPEFVAKILAAKNEKTTRVNPVNIWESIL